MNDALMGNIPVSDGNSMMAFGHIQVFNPRQDVSKLSWLVDQDGEMLRANPPIPFPVSQGYQRNLVLAFIAV